MGELSEALGAIGGLAFGGFVVLLLAPHLDSMTPLNLSGLGILMFGGAVVLTMALIIVLTTALTSSR